MASFNKVILVGNLCADPELKATSVGRNVVKVSIAVARKKTQANPNPPTDFFEIEAWGYAAEFIARYFIKGKPILVCGKLKNNSWTANDGNKKMKTIIEVEEATFVENKNGATTVADNALPSSATVSAPQYGIGDGFEEISADDDLPF